MGDATSTDVGSHAVHTDARGDSQSALVRRCSVGASSSPQLTRAVAFGTVSVRGIARQLWHPQIWRLRSRIIACHRSADDTSVDGPAAPTADAIAHFCVAVVQLLTRRKVFCVLVDVLVTQ